MLVRFPYMLALVMTATAIAACGSGGGDQQSQLSQDEYQAAIQKILQDSTAPTSLYTDLVVRPRRQKQCASMMRTFYDEVNGLTEQVAALDPPDDVAAIQQRFVSAASQSVDRVGEIRDQVEEGKVTCGRELNDMLYGMPSSKQAEQAISDLEKQGYVVFGK